jgi:formylglycine-generating enzyme required for sulfatase activity
MNAEQIELAKQKVQRFVDSFGPSHRLLACYAILPLILTPELLNYLRNHFLRGEVPWVAESDLLLSELCRPVAHEQFAMATEVRAYLLGVMREDVGEVRIQEAARLLIRHVHQLARLGSTYTREGLQAEQWSAMAYLTERRSEAARQIAQSFRDSLLGEPSGGLDPRTYVPVAELARLARITAQLEPQLREYPELLDYAAEVGRLVSHPQGVSVLADVRKSGQPTVRSGKLGVTLPNLQTGARAESEPSEPPLDEANLAPTPFRDRFRDGSGEGPEMIWLPGGTFRIGSPERLGEDNERPAHDVTLSHFGVGKFPLTVGEFRRFAESTGYKTEAEQGGGALVWNRGNPGEKKDANWRNPYMAQDDDHPVVCISWNDAKEYCKWLSEVTGQNYCLLTEAQWEFACRAGSDTAYCFGDDEKNLEAYAWFGDRSESGSTHPVGTKKPNAWDLNDMHGNVWEWCADWYAEDYYEQLASSAVEVASGAASETALATSDSANGASRDPSGPESGSARVIRGGSWSLVAGICRSAYRDREVPGYRDDDLGFRLSRTGPWPSYTLTLARQRAEERTRAEAAQRTLEPAPKPRFEPYQGFRDALEDGGEAPEMVYLPGGTFLMGDAAGGSDEKPVHAVRLDAFAIGRTPVTAGEYLRFCEATGEHWPRWLEEGSEYHIETGSNHWYRECGVSREAMDLPIVGVSWEDARAYCTWLGAQTSETYALLTEAQWEYACRAGSQTRYCFGDDEKALGEYAWYTGNAGGKLHPVGKKKPGVWGLADMHGNVWEWCADWYARDYYEQLASAARNAASKLEQTASELQQPASENPVGPDSGSYRVVRGGSWRVGAGGCRSADRGGRDPGYRGDDLGFRLSRTV